MDIGDVNEFRSETYYVLDEYGVEPIKLKDAFPDAKDADERFERWAKWFENSQRNAQRSVTRTDFGAMGYVSTVFLATDHDFSTRDEPWHRPVLWETMVFNGPFDEVQVRARSWCRAVATHSRIVKPMKKAYDFLLKTYEGDAIALDTVLRLGNFDMLLKRHRELRQISWPYGMVERRR